MTDESVAWPSSESMNKIDGDAVGALEPVEVLYETEKGPGIFTMRNSCGAIQLAYLAEDLEDEKLLRFIVVPTSDAMVARMKAGSMSVRDALKRQHVELVDADYAFKPRRAGIVRFDDMPPDALPPRSTMLMSGAIKAAEVASARVDPDLTQLRMLASLGSRPSRTEEVEEGCAKLLVHPDEVERRHAAITRVRLTRARVRQVSEAPANLTTLTENLTREIARLREVLDSFATESKRTSALRERNEALQVEACEQHTTLLELQEVLSDTSVDERELEAAELVHAAHAARALAFKCSELILEIGRARDVLDAPSHETLLDAAKRAVASNPPLAPPSKPYHLDGPEELASVRRELADGKAEST